MATRIVRGVFPSSVLHSAIRIPHFAISLSGLLLMASAAFAGPAEDYVTVQLVVVSDLEARLNEVATIADLAAKRLVAGGQLYLAGEPGMVAELNVRAGGLCGAKAYPDAKKQPTAADVVLFSRYWPTRKPPPHHWTELAATQALVVLVTPGKATLRSAPPENVLVIPVANAPGGSMLGDGPEDIVIPRGPRTYAQALAIAQWTFVAELLGAGRRQGKQLAVYLSIHLDPGGKRFARTHGLMFEPDLRPEPVPRGEYAKAFLGHVRTALEAVQRDEAGKIRQAAAWLREARAAGHKVVRHLHGHLPPAEVGLPGDPASLFTDTVTGEVGAKGAEWIRKNLGQGDVYLLVAYQQNEDAMAAAANALGARTIFLTSLPPSPEQAKNPLHLYINPHWPLTDACLDLSGYDVKACPLSAIMGMTAFSALCAEALAGQ